MADSERVVFYGGCVDDINEEKRRAIFVRPIYASREIEGEYHTLFKEIIKDDDKFFNYTRMSQSSFYKLLSIVETHISPGWTNYRKSICAEERLIITLR